MTNAELIKHLHRHPASAEVLIYSAEEGELAPITGLVTGPGPDGVSGRGKYTIELYSDTMGD